MDSKISKILELIKTKQLHSAEKECLKLIDENNKNYEYYNIYSIVCYQLEKYDLAIKSWQKAIEIIPRYFFGYNNIGKAVLNLNKFGVPEPIKSKKIVPNVALVPVLAFDKFWENVKVIGPIGDIQLATAPADDLILLLSSILLS